jgi:predicted RNA binding protein YcfA (HicA-like mRNA interferase family)
MPRKIRQFKKEIKDLGFASRPGKGRHQIWNHPLLTDPIVIARKDGDDVPDYLERKLEIALELLKEERDS